MLEYTTQADGSVGTASDSIQWVDRVWSEAEQYAQDEEEAYTSWK